MSNQRLLDERWYFGGETSLAMGLAKSYFIDDGAVFRLRREYPAYEVLIHARMGTDIVGVNEMALLSYPQPNGEGAKQVFVNAIKTPQGCELKITELNTGWSFIEEKWHQFVDNLIAQGWKITTIPIREADEQIPASVKMPGLKGQVADFVVWVGEESSPTRKCPQGIGTISVDPLAAPWPTAERNPKLELSGRLETPEVPNFPLPSWLIRFSVTTTTPNKFDVLVECRETAVAPYFHYFVKRIKESWTDGDSSTGEQPQKTSPPKRKSRKSTGMTEERKRRALIFKEIKDANPRLSYAGVAMRANADYSEQFSKEIEPHDVRNDYEAMGWKWKRADRIR